MKRCYQYKGKIFQSIESHDRVDYNMIFTTLSSIYDSVNTDLYLMCRRGICDQTEEEDTGKTEKLVTDCERSEEVRGGAVGEVHHFSSLHSERHHGLYCVSER